MAEKFDPKKTTLIQRAVALENARKRREQDIETAKKQIPDLIEALHEFVDSSLPEDSELRMLKPKEEKPKTEEEKAEIMRNLGKISDKSRAVSIRHLESMLQESRTRPNAVTIEKEIQIGRQNKVQVDISRGLEGNIYGVMTSDLTVDLPQLPWIYILDKGKGRVESRDHNHREFTMNTPMGSSSDAGPKWRRSMRTTDVANVAGLLDLLKRGQGAEPKVTQFRVSRRSY